MDREGVRQLLGHTCLEILPNGVKVVDNQGNESVLEADTVCYSVGMNSRSDTVLLLKGAAPGVPVFEVGDCTCPGKVANATEAAYRAALQIS